MILLALDDITDERRIVRRQLQLMIDSLPGAFAVVGRERRMRFISRQIGPLFGYQDEELVGQPIDLLLPADQRERHAGLFADFFANPTTRQMGPGLDIYGLAKDGSKIPLTVGLSPLQTAEGLLIVAAIHDLRQQKQSEELLRAAKADADRANQAKSRVLAAASHDLRQPLQTLGLLHGLLENHVTDPDAQSTLTKLDNTVADMTELLDTLLDINQIDRGEIKPEITEFSLAPLFARVRDEFTAIANAKDLRLRVVPSSIMVDSDRRLLVRMVSNLLSNAIKYTNKGKVLVGCRRRGNSVRIEVWDTGIGIPPEALTMIFQEFYRVERAEGERFGLGLGLYIVQRFAALLGHRVEVQSKPGRGTMFAIVANAKFLDAGQNPVGEASGAASLSPTILVIEDDAPQLHALDSLLKSHGFRVAGVRTGAEALALSRQGRGIRPNVVVADYNLPGDMNGADAIRRLRAEIGAQIPALIVSGDRSEAAIRAFEATGVNFMIKPVRAADLLASVEALAKIPGSSGLELRPATSGMSAAPSQADVAVIDDDPGVREALRVSLEAEGYKVTVFDSAEAFLADPGRGLFRCLVIDLVLPGMDGLALQSRLKTERVGVPIVFVSGSEELPLAVKAMREGAVDFLQKPVRPEELRLSIAGAIRQPGAGVRQGEEQADVAARLASLTERERDVLRHILAGQANKNIAAELGISQRTTEHHRQSVMKKMGARSLAMLIRMVLPHFGPELLAPAPPVLKEG
jgi:two-component system, chemotaxis family, CheB/CheR fusion protein